MTTTYKDLAEVMAAINSSDIIEVSHFVNAINNMSAAAINAAPDARSMMCLLQ